MKTIIVFLALCLSLCLFAGDNFAPGQDKKIQNCYSLTCNGTPLRLNDKWEPPEGAVQVGEQRTKDLLDIKFMRKVFGEGLLAYEFIPDNPNPFSFVKDNKAATIYHYVIYILPKDNDPEKN